MPLAALLLACAAQGTGSPPAPTPTTTAAEVAARIASRDDATIEASVLALAKMGKEGAQELWKLHAHERIWVRTLALHQLSLMRAEASDCLPALADGLAAVARSDHPSILGAVQGCSNACRSLESLLKRPDFRRLKPGEPLEEVDEFLVSLERTLYVHAVAAAGAADIENLFLQLAPRLPVGADMGWGDVAVALAWAAGEQPGPTVAFLKARVQSAQKAERLPLLTLLAGTRAEGRELWPVCYPLLEDADPTLRAIGLEVLADGPAKETNLAPERLRALSGDPSSIVRLEFARFLAYCKDDEPGTLRVLLPLVDQGDAAARRNALGLWASELLSSIANDDRQAKRLLPMGSSSVPILTRALADDQHWNREHACTLLGLYGAEASSALSALRRLSKDPLTRVRKRADWAVRRIEGALEPPKPAKPRQPSKPR